MVTGRVGGGMIRTFILPSDPFSPLPSGPRGLDRTEWEWCEGARYARYGLVSLCSPRIRDVARSFRDTDRSVREMRDRDRGEGARHRSRAPFFLTPSITAGGRARVKWRARRRWWKGCGEGTTRDSLRRKEPPFMIHSWFPSTRPSPLTGPSHPSPSRPHGSPEGRGSPPHPTSFTHVVHSLVVPSSSLHSSSGGMLGLIKGSDPTFHRRITLRKECHVPFYLRSFLATVRERVPPAARI